MFRFYTSLNFYGCDAGILVKALGPGWAHFSEEIGLWLPVEIINKEHDDKPEGAEDLGTDLPFHFFIFMSLHQELHFSAFSSYILLSDKKQGMYKFPKRRFIRLEKSPFRLSKECYIH